MVNMKPELNKLVRSSVKQYTLTVEKSFLSEIGI